MNIEKELNNNNYEKKLKKYIAGKNRPTYLWLMREDICIANIMVSTQVGYLDASFF